jgi:heme/copper-type cytochrome/quinol oxidase subunit 2
LVINGIEDINIQTLIIFDSNIQTLIIFNNFDSFIIPTSQLKLNEFRLLKVDNRCILPLNYNIRIITTSIDVIHA